MCNVVRQLLLYLEFTCITLIMVTVMSTQNFHLEITITEIYLSPLNYTLQIIFLM